MAQHNSIDELFLNQTGTPPASGSGKGFDIAAGALQLGSAALSASASKPDFKKYVKTKCGNKPFLAGKKKRDKYQQCSDAALKEYSALGQAPVSPPPPSDQTGGGDTSGSGGAGTTGGGMSTNTILLIAGGVVVLGIVAYFVLRNK